MQCRLILLTVIAAAGAMGQAPCPATPMYSRCELAFELNEAERKQHPNPYVSVEMQAEFRSPKHRTVMMPAFYDGDGRMIVRFTPMREGEWAYRVTSNISRFDGMQGTFTATESDTPGFIRPANGHHWRHTGNQLAHLWMGDTMYTIAFLDDESFRRVVDTRAEQKFTHIRGYAVGRDGSPHGATFRSPDQPDYAWYRRLDERIAYMNGKGIIFDMILGHDQNHLAKAFPTPADRQRYLRYLAARYSGFNITWQLTQEFEEYENGRALLNEMGTALKALDPYDHPRSTHAVTTSAPLLPDGWMDHVIYQSANDDLGSIEHQLYAVPFVNAEFAYENSGAGASHAHHVDAGEFRRRLWNSFMNGQYPTHGNTGTYGGLKVPLDLKHLDAPGAKAMTVWFDFVSATRYWDLEPFFDVDGGRGMALADTEYIIYVEKPSGPVEVRVPRHGYDVKWLNPINGETVPLKDWKGDRFVAEAPGREHDWVLHISREGRKQGMLRSYKFESRPFMMQEPDSTRTGVPFEIASPSAEEVSVAAPPAYEAKLKRETRGTRRMRYLWTGEVPIEQRGYRVLGTGAEGTWRISRDLARSIPAVMNVRLYGLNANGKLYFVDRLFRLVP